MLSMDSKEQIEAAGFQTVVFNRPLSPGEQWLANAGKSQYDSRPEAAAGAFWQAAQLNISDPVMMQVHAAIMQQKDFALRAENGSINYFIGGQILIRLGGSMDGVTHLTDRNALLSAVKIALLGHREFVSGAMLFKDAAYNSFIRTLTVPIEPVAMEAPTLITYRK